MTTTHPQNKVSIEFLEAFGDAWNRHDVDTIMTAFTDDCVFMYSWGPDVWGAQFEGRDQVREAVSQIFKRFPDVHYSGASHFVSGNRGVSEWTFTATGPDGKRLEMLGCDIFTFKNGKIAVKNAFRKNRLS